MSEFILTSRPEEGGTASYTVVQEYNPEYFVAELSAYSAAGYVFSGWLSGNDDKFISSINPYTADIEISLHDVTYTALFTKMPGYVIESVNAVGTIDEISYINDIGYLDEVTAIQELSHIDTLSYIEEVSSIKSIESGYITLSYGSTVYVENLPTVSTTSYIKPAVFITNLAADMYKYQDFGDFATAENLLNTDPAKYNPAALARKCLIRAREFWDALPDKFKKDMCGPEIKGSADIG